MKKTHVSALVFQMAPLEALGLRYTYYKGFLFFQLYM